MEPTKENAPAFGYADLSQRMRERIERHFRAPSPGADRSLVIGIFGEWGSGKSTLLEAVGSGFDKPGADHATLTIPVRFNPWRYEKEQHLIVPLLKKTELALRARLEPDLTPEQQITGAMFEQVRKAARFTGIAALSFLSMFKARVGIPGVGDMNIDPQAGIDQAKALLDEGNKPPEEKDPLTALSSHYFDFEQRLEALTRGGGDGTRLNLLFLIDDLDRCLPEKAVEMLESIKLFLDVEGCAFVVALDDEVVERGVQHRYKDYLFNSHGEKDVRPPITGAEYLEKIIHLPFRLPAPTRNEIRAFLRRFELFAVTEQEEPGKDDSETKSTRRTEPRAPAKAERNDELLELFVRAIPPVPRKLIRAVELLEMQSDAARARGWQNFDLLTLARITLLQLFAPALYRHARKHYPGLLIELEDWAEEHKDHWQRDDFDEHLRGKYQDKSQADKNTLDRSLLPLIKLIDEVRKSRSGFDPARLLSGPPSDRRNPERYFSLLDETPETPRQGRASPAEQRPSASLTDPDTFLDLMFSSSEGSWASALGMAELQGAILSDADFQRVLARLNEPAYRDLPLRLDWVEALSTHLSASQIQRLYKDTDLLQRLAGQDHGEGAAL